MGKTEGNLVVAFLSESQANRKYLAFAERADQEGYRQVAKLFRAAALAEVVHAHAHLEVMGGIKSTRENLRSAMEEESYEYTKRYPGFIEQAVREGNRAAARSFEYARQVEQIHEALYRQALQTLEAGKPLEEKDYYVCPICGNTMEGEAPDSCPLCLAPKRSLMRV